MVGFNLLGDTLTGPPFFYYETIALSSKGVEGSSFLYSIMPEFVDSKFFYAAASKRGYIHNLLIENMSPLTPMPPKDNTPFHPVFYIYPDRFHIFWQKRNRIRKRDMKYEISLGLIPIVFRISRF
jgi:hypothetical protein